MAIYLKYDTVKGNVTTEGFKDWIELNSCQFGAGRSLGTGRAGGANRAGNEPSLSEVVCTKDWDSVSSSKLFEESVKGELGHKVEIHFTVGSSGNKAPQAQLIVKLEKCGIASYSMSGSGGNSGAPTESFSLNFTKIEITPFKVEANQAPAKGTAVNYDMESGKANA
jgi:type VI secretion system secreted protein Hcp